jgi:hypothetical protein
MIWYIEKGIKAMQNTHKMGVSSSKVGMSYPESKRRLYKCVER